MTDPTILRMTTDIVASYVAHHSVQTNVLPDLIKEIYTALSTIDIPAQAEKPQPAVAVRKSVFPDYIICLDDGKKLKMLKRHLKTTYGLSPEQYRERWGLPHDYPMVAPNYAQHRSLLAKKIGLGRNPAIQPIPKKPVARATARPDSANKGRAARAAAPAPSSREPDISQTDAIDDQQILPMQASAQQAAHQQAPHQQAPGEASVVHTIDPAPQAAGPARAKRGYTRQTPVIPRAKKPPITA